MPVTLGLILSNKKKERENNLKVFYKLMTYTAYSYVSVHTQAVFINYIAET